MHLPVIHFIDEPSESGGAIHITLPPYPEPCKVDLTARAVLLQTVFHVTDTCSPTLIGSIDMDISPLSPLSYSCSSITNSIVGVTDAGKYFSL